MNLSEFNILLTIFWILTFLFVIGFENNFKSLILSEFIWISLFCFYLITAIVYDDYNVLSLTLFFLIFSAIEISICLIIIILQKKLFKNINLFFDGNNFNNTGLVKFRNLISSKYKY